MPLETSLSAGRLRARIDDARLRAGGYELRARAVDAAGNATVGTARTDGAPATVTLPLRKRVTMKASRSGRLVTVRLLDGTTPLADREVTFEQRLRGRTAWRRVCGRRTVVVAGSPSAPPPAPRARSATDAGGRVRLRLRPGPSRTVRARFAGDARLLPARASVVLRAKARVRLRAVPPAVRAGATVSFRGRLLGGHLPAGGKVVDVQARVGAGWRTFATVRTGRAAGSATGTASRRRAPAGPTGSACSRAGRRRIRTRRARARRSPCASSERVSDGGLLAARRPSGRARRDRRSCRSLRTFRRCCSASRGELTGRLA